MFCEIGDRIRFMGSHQASGMIGTVVEYYPAHSEPACLSPLNGLPDDLFEDTSSRYYPDIAMVKLDRPAPSKVPGNKPFYFPIYNGGSRKLYWRKAILEVKDGH